VRIVTAVVALTLLGTHADDQSVRPKPGPERESERRQLDHEGDSATVPRWESCNGSTDAPSDLRSSAAGAGIVKGQSIIGYDADAKFTFYFISAGRHLRGANADRVWTWTGGCARCE
jgi:hypothetical protein